MLLVIIGTVLAGTVTAQLDGLECNRFADVPESDKVVAVVNDVCYYGFGRSEPWQVAERLCESQGTHLAHVQTAAKQLAIYKALGTNFGQHWTGLHRMDGQYWWVFNSTHFISADADIVGTGRFEGPTSGNYTYTQTSTHQQRLKFGDPEWYYKPVCEESTMS